MNYQDINAAAINRWVEEGWEWGTPISHPEYENALAGKWNVLLTPTKYVPHVPSSLSCKMTTPNTGCGHSWLYGIIRRKQGTSVHPAYHKP